MPDGGTLTLSNSSSVNSDQITRSAASDLSLHCLHMSLYGNLGIKGRQIVRRCPKYCTCT